MEMQKKRWLLSLSYNLSKENIKTRLGTIFRNLALSSSSYDNVIVLGDFNVGVEEVNMSNFCSTSDLQSLI